MKEGGRKGNMKINGQMVGKKETGGDWELHINRIFGQGTWKGRKGGKKVALTAAGCEGNVSRWS